jgi:iron complex transport system substrate-binding protein
MISLSIRAYWRLWIAAVVAASLAAAFAQPRPARIVSTFPSVTETLFALGVGDRVAGVSDYCRYPPAVLSLPRVGSYIKPDAEKIARLRPDLVVIEKSATGLSERLSALGIRHADVTIGSLADIYSMIRDIGSAVGLAGDADKLNRNIRTRLDALRAEASAGPHPNVLIVLGRTPGLLTNLIAVGDSTYLGELLRIAGGSNAVSGSSIPYPHISLETVVRANPDVILDASMMGTPDSQISGLEQRLRQPWLEHHELKAIRNGAIFGLTSEVLVTPGPRVADAVELIRSRIRISKL